MKTTRRTARFRVEPSFPLRVYIPQSLSKTYSLRTLGEGGLGFYAPARDAQLVQHPTVDLRFTVGDRVLSLKGTVQYCTFLPRQGANYFGIQFSDLDNRQGLVLKSIIQAALKKGHLVEAHALAGSS